MGDCNRRRDRIRTALVVGGALLAVFVAFAAGTATPGDGRASAVGHSSTVADRGQQTTTGANGTDDATDASDRTAPTFDASVFRDVAGQVAVEDGVVAVRGTATGTDEVLVALFDRRGRVATEIVPVDDDGAFEENDLELVTDDGTPLAEGRVVATVLAAGRDERVGDGEVGNATRGDLGAFEAAFRETVGQRSGTRAISRTQRQLVELYYDQTVEDSGSDDLLLAEEFVYTDARTSIQRVVAQSAANATGSVEPIRVGDTVVVRGLTNLRPDDNTIFVEVVGGPSVPAFDLAATDSWDTDGVWEVRLDSSGVEPGVYTVEADDGASSDSVRVRILPRVANESRNANAAGPRAVEANRPRASRHCSRFCRFRGFGESFGG